MCKNQASTKLIYEEKCGTVTIQKCVKNVILKQVTKLHQVYDSVFMELWC